LPPRRSADLGRSPPCSPGPGPASAHLAAMSTHQRRRHAKLNPYEPTANGVGAPEAGEVPVVLPLLVVNVTETGTLTVTLDGADFPPPDDEHAWTRKSFGRLLDAATREREVSMRVEVHETDGTSFTDLIPAKIGRAHV